MNRNLAGAPEGGGRAKQHYCSEEDVHGQRLMDAELDAKRLCEFFTESTEVEVREKEDPLSSVTQYPDCPPGTTFCLAALDVLTFPSQSGEQRNGVHTYCFD